jgi:hypothetical protein
VTCCARWSCWRRFALGHPALAEGVNVGKPSSVRNLVPAGALENQAAQEYEQLKRQASARRALGPDDHPQVKRLRAIATRMIPFVERFNPACPAMAVGSQSDRLEADQCLLHAGRQDRLLYRHPRHAQADATTRWRW